MSDEPLVCSHGRWGWCDGEMRDSGWKIRILRLDCICSHRLKVGTGIAEFQEKQKVLDEWPF